MKSFIAYFLGFFLIQNSSVYSQTNELKKDTFYILIPKKMKVGYSSIDTKQVRDTNAVAYVFGGFSSSPFDDQAFSLEVKKKRHVEKQLPAEAIKLTPLQVMDSLQKKGRSFFKENVFFAVFKNCNKVYIHSCKGEYIYMDYSDE